MSDPQQNPLSDSGPAHAGAIPPEGRIVELEQALNDAQTKAEEQYDAFLRAKAEADNARRRAAEEVTKAHKFGVEKFADALLAVKDSLDAALATENASVESFKTGVELTARQLDNVFEKFSISEINPLGEKFNPARHQAISTVPSAQEPNTVVTVAQKGFLLHDRVLRPALVIVSRAADIENR